MSAPSKAAVSRPASLGYGAALGDLLLRLAVTPETTLDKASAPAYAPRFSTADDPEEFATEEPTYALVDMTGGEGLYYAHRPSDDPRDAKRFWSSRGIDSSPTLPGDPSGLRLLKDTELLDGVAITSVEHAARLSSGEVIVDQNDGVLVYETPLTGSLDTEDPHTGTENVTGLAAIGDVAYAACGTDGAAIRSAAGSWSDLASAPTADGGVSGLWAAKGRLFATVTNGEVFAELHPTTGAATTLLTLPSGSTVTAVCDAGSVIFVAATTGVIYAFVLEDDGTLVQAGQTQLGANEYATTMVAAFGTIMIGTAQATGSTGLYGRFYVGRVNVDTLRDLQLYRVFNAGADVDRAPSASVAYRDSLYMAIPDTAGATVWRLHLATGALTEHFQFNDSFVGAGRAVGLFVDAELMVAPVQGTTFGLYREAATYEPTGYLISSAADFFTSRLKEWTSMRVSGSNLSGGASVTVAVTTNPAAMLDPTHAAWLPIAGFYSNEQWDSLYTLVDVASSRYLAVRVTLNSSSTGLVSPIVASVVTFASLLPDEILVRMPVNVSDRVERPNRLPIVLPGLGKVIEQELIALQGTYQTLELYRYPMILYGIIMNVETTTPGVEDRGSGTLMAIVTFRGRVYDPTAGGFVTGEASVGMGTLGLHTMGL